MNVNRVALIIIFWETTSRCSLIVTLATNLAGKRGKCGFGKGSEGGKWKIHNLLENGENFLTNGVFSSDLSGYCGCIELQNGEEAKLIDLCVRQ